MLSLLKKIITEKKEEYKIYFIPSLILVIFLFFTYEYFYRYYHIFKSPEEVRKYILLYGKYSIAAFLVLQVLQVVIFIIPGEVIQISGGYIFGTFLGSIISLIGIAAGSSAAFYASRKFGKSFVRKIIPEKKMNYFENKLKSSNLNLIVFLLYLTPGIPKDILAYVCGISSIGFKDFFILSTIGRIPGIIISAYFGANIKNKKYMILVIIAVVMTVLFILGTFKGDKIFKSIKTHLKNK